MGRFSQSVFGRRRLPERTIIYAGSYVPSRKETVRSLFGKWKLVRGNWLPYAFARKGRREFLILFNVYGASMTLEALHLIKDGGVRKVFFIGSMFAKRIPIGKLVLPTRVVDMAGIVSIDNPGHNIVRAESYSIKRLESRLEASCVPFEKARIVSVPCVLHDIKPVTEFIAGNNQVEGVEMETSTFTHFSKKLGMKSYAVLYVSDNERVDVISTARTVRAARKKALRNITRLAIEVL